LPQNHLPTEVCIAAYFYGPPEVGPHFTGDYISGDPLFLNRDGTPITIIKGWKFRRYPMPRVPAGYKPKLREYPDPPPEPVLASAPIPDLNSYAGEHVVDYSRMAVLETPTEKLTYPNVDTSTVANATVEPVQLELDLELELPRLILVLDRHPPVQQQRVREDFNFAVRYVR
jgi:hypothetical protein